MKRIQVQQEIDINLYHLLLSLEEGSSNCKLPQSISTKIHDLKMEIDKLLFGNILKDYDIEDSKCLMVFELKKETN